MCLINVEIYSKSGPGVSREHPRSTPGAPQEHPRSASPCNAPGAPQKSSKNDPGVPQELLGSTLDTESSLGHIDQT